MYKIAKGDQLDKIATKYKSDREKILAFNTGLDPSNMVAGQTIIIPDGVMPYTAPPRPTVASPSAVFAPSPEALANIQMIWPSSCKRITQYYKWNHAGIDIGCPFGVPIYASDEGIVEYAGWGNGGWGNTIVINHGDGRKTRYSHASKILVTKGEFVAKGQVIMLEGSTGHSTGPHLDFRIYINGQTVNPLSYVR
jgi:murein DD-endopeptidase MepM/ murein hydrolase activator NlpD